jgi:hypothetical protein
MALQIPDNFDVYTEKLDVNETFIRDALSVQIENWARFRYTIHVGNDADNLHSQGPVSEEVKAAYRELAKSHYEVITSLGCAAVSLEMVVESLEIHPILFKKSVKDFYFHTGCLLDNLARLIYIVNDPHSATETNRRHHLLRHWVDWGSLRDYAGYARLKRSKHLREVINIRNNLTHSWSCPVVFINNIPHWPLAIRRKRNHPWLYDERDTLRRRYRSWLPLLPMLKGDLEFVERFQHIVFGKLVRDVRKFDRNHSVQIR